jgi:mevalonate kinase
MIQSASAPAKIILFGEWAVLHGGSGVAIALPPRLQITWKQAEHKRDDAVMMIRGESQIALWDPKQNLSKQSQVPAFFYKLVQILENLQKRSPHLQKALEHGGELRVERDWPLDYGLGSSSALVACLLELFDTHQERLQKWLWGRDVLRQAQGAASGLDLAAQIRGGAVSLNQEHPRPLLNFEIPQNIFFMHAHQKADTSAEIKKAPLTQEQIKSLGQSADHFLKTQNWSLALEEHAQILENSALWPDSIRQARTEWIKRGLVKNMKSCGAGGGDTWMIEFLPENVHANFKELEAECLEKNWVLKKYEIENRGVEKRQ